MTEETKNDSVETTVQKQQPIELIRKFELAIYNEDITDDGKPRYKQVAFERPVIVEARNPKELNEKLSLYKEAGQIAKVIREIDPPSKEQIEAYVNQQKQTAIDSRVNNVQQTQIQSNDVQQSSIQNAIKTQHAVSIAKKPRYYKVGDIEIKDDNGKIYQKQWMKLSDTEASNIRLINDKNNALVNINGKHFEMKRWILVDTTELDETTQLEDNLK